MPRLLGLPWVVAALLMAMAGCESTPKASAGLAGALSEYDAGRYDAAHTKAVAAMQGATGADREQAAYVAGLSAYRKRDYIEAEHRLTTAAASSDRTVSGRAKAALGLVCLAQNRPATGAVHLAEAARVLDGPDASEAAFRAGVAYQLAGDESAAQRQFAYARSVESSSGVSGGRASTGGGGGSGGTSGGASGGATGGSWANPPSGLFAIQVGAFSDMTNARSAADQARRFADRHGLGEVRIIPKSDARQRTLYVVQFGRFTSRTSAEAALRQLAEPRYIIAPLMAG